MTAINELEAIAKQNQTSLFPNVAREYLQHIFLAELYSLPEASTLLFKGGTALRIIYGSPRFSEDLDFSLYHIRTTQIKTFVEELFLQVLTNIERTGIQVRIGEKSHITSGGYFGIATFTLFGLQSVTIELNISTRSDQNVRGEVDVIASDFAATYSIVHLPQELLVEEKIFSALRTRKKPRDFYDLYFMMRKNMLSAEQKKRLALLGDEIITAAQKIDFRSELGTFLPTNQQSIIRDFPHTLTAELHRQIA